MVLPDTGWKTGALRHMGNRFTAETAIIDDKDVLRDDWQPETMAEREDELDEYADALRPVVKGWQPNNVFAYGVTGAGKTAGTRSLIRELLEAVDRETDDVNLNVVEVNCNSLNTSYQVAINIINEMRSPTHRLTTVDLDREPIAETGHPQKRVFNELYGDIEAMGGTVLFVLDEIDNIGTDDDILYELPRARTTHDLETKVGVIGISNDFTFRDNLSPKVKDTLCEEEILFEPYDAGHLENILSRRAEQAFISPDVYDASALSLCAGLAARDSGSARQALNLLRTAAEIAERAVIEGERDEECITEDDVREAEHRRQRQQIVEGMHSLTRHGHYVLLTICELTAAGETPARTKEIHRRYEKIVTGLGGSPLKRRRVHDHLSDLTLHGILEQVDTTDGRGNYNMYDLDVQLSSALDALDTELDEVSLDSVRDRADENGVLQ